MQFWNHESTHPGILLRFLHVFVLVSYRAALRLHNPRGQLATEFERMSFLR